MDRPSSSSSRLPFFGVAGVLAVMLALAGLAPFRALTAAPPTAPAGPTDGTSARPPAGVRPALELLADYLLLSPAPKGIDPVPELLRAGEDEALLRAVRERLGTGEAQPKYDLTVLVATLPDYVDSFSAWTFDGNLDALQRAAGTAQYVIDRFYLPDWDPEKRGREIEGKRHETEPAVLLFRHLTNPKKLLLVLVTLETATEGVHKRAFVSAVSLARLLEPKAPVRVLGPSFSGSTRSIRLALQAWVDATLGTKCEGLAPVVIRTGSATNLSNKGVLEAPFDCGGREADCVGLVDFAALTVSDPDAQAAMSHFLGELNSDWALGQGVALLHESNTSFGLEQGGHADCRSWSTQAFPCATRLAFPLHISRLRSEASARSTPQPKGAGEGPVSFRLDEARTPRDQLPPLRPESTAAVVQTSLEQILDSIERLGVTAVGLYGTDPRDKIFLAQQISRRSPNVLIFTLEPSVALLHADYRAYVRGAIVAGSYPLFSGTQALLPGTVIRSPQHQFPTAGAEGIYNALLNLLGLPERMLDYGWGCQATAEGSPSSCQPAVWISVVGQDALWPLRRYPLDPVRNKGYTWPLGPSDASRVLASSSAASVAEKTGSAARALLQRPLDPEPPPLPVQASWPSLVLFAAALVATLILAHVAIGATIVWQLTREQAGHPPGRIAALDAAGHWLLGRIRRHVPTFEPPDLCAEHWTAEPVRHERRSGLRQEYWVSLAACGGALLAVSIVFLHLAIIGLNTGLDPETTRRGALAMLVRRTLGLAFLVAAIAAVWPSRPRREARLTGLIVLRIVPVAMGLVALVHLDTYLSSGLWEGPLAGFTVMRAISLRSLVSPLIPVVALAAGVYLWGLWNLWRLHVQAVEFGNENALILTLRDKQPFAALTMRRLLDSPPLAVGLLAATLLGIVAAFQMLLGHRLGLRTADGAAMGRFVIVGTMLLAFLVGHALAFGFRQGRTLLRCLRALDRLPLSHGLAQLSSEAFLWRLSAGIPKANEVTRLVLQAEAASRALERSLPHCSLLEVRDPAYLLTVNGPRATERPRPSVDEMTLAGAYALHVRSADVVALRHVPMPLWSPATEEDARRPLQASPPWRALNSWSQPLLKLLERGPWQGPSGDPGSFPELFRSAERLLSMQVAFTLRHALVRLTKVFELAVLSLLLLLAAHLLYSFQGRVFWLSLDWVLLGLATAVVLFFLVRLEKDAVLSRLWATDPGRLNWNGELVRRILVYGALPVITLFMTLFPEVGGSLFDWLGPVQKVLP